MATPRLDPKNLLNQTPGEVLGVVKESITDPSVEQETVGWGTQGADIDFKEPPPPWEQYGEGGLDAGDARKVVDYPKNWKVRWFNPRMIEQNGWNHWKPVSVSNPQIKVKIESMVAPDGNIRRGGFDDGDILCWMYLSWYESLVKKTHALTAQRTQAAVDKQENLKDEFNRGKFGPYVHLDSARHPTHTIGEGRTMTDL